MDAYLSWKINAENVEKTKTPRSVPMWPYLNPGLSGVEAHAPVIPRRLVSEVPARPDHQQERVVRVAPALVRLLHSQAVTLLVRISGSCDLHLVFPRPTILRPVHQLLRHLLHVAGVLERPVQGVHICDECVHSAPFGLRHLVPGIPASDFARPAGLSAAGHGNFYPRPAVVHLPVGPVVPVCPAEDTKTGFAYCRTISSFQG